MDIVKAVLGLWLQVALQVALQEVMHVLMFTVLIFIFICHCHICRKLIKTIVSVSVSYFMQFHGAKTEKNYERRKTVEKKARTLKVQNKTLTQTDKLCDLY